jgi:hypothetical protein
MKLFLKALGLVLLAAGSTSAQEPKQTSQPPARTVVLDIDVLDVNLDQRGEIERIVKDKRSLDRLIVEGKARPIAAIQVRARTGEAASARMGQRVPIQASTNAAGTAQLQYENTGLNVDVEPRMVESDRIAIKLKIELTAVVRNENILAPTFVQRTFNDIVNVRPGEPVVLISVTQHEGLLPASPKPGSKPGEQAGGSFVIVLTARLLD